MRRYGGSSPEGTSATSDRWLSLSILVDWLTVHTGISGWPVLYIWAPSISEPNETGWASNDCVVGHTVSAQPVCVLSHLFSTCPPHRQHLYVV